MSHKNCSCKRGLRKKIKISDYVLAFSTQLEISLFHVVDLQRTGRKCTETSCGKLFKHFEQPHHRADQRKARRRHHKPICGSATSHALSPDTNCCSKVCDIPANLLLQLRRQHSSHRQYIHLYLFGRLSLKGCTTLLLFFGSYWLGTFSKPAPDDYAAYSIVATAPCALVFYRRLPLLFQLL